MAFHSARPSPTDNHAHILKRDQSASPVSAWTPGFFGCNCLSQTRGHWSRASPCEDGAEAPSYVAVASCRRKSGKTFERRVNTALRDRGMTYPIPSKKTPGVAMTPGVRFAYCSSRFRPRPNCHCRRSYPRPWQSRVGREQPAFPAARIPASLRPPRPHPIEPRRHREE